MRLLLIHPGDSGSELAMLTYRNPTPLVLPLLASLTPPGWEVTIRDENVGPVDLGWNGNLVGLTVAVHKAPRAIALARAFRERGIPVVMGGLYPTLNPEAALSAADAVVTGAAEGVWPRLLADVCQGALAPLYRNDGTPPAIAAIDAGAITMDETRCYVEAGRGCGCGDPWCSICASQGTVLQRRPPEAIVAEIVASQAVNPALNLRFLLGERLLDDEGWAELLCQALAPLGVLWSACVTLDTPASMLERACGSGCFLVLVDADAADTTGGLGQFVARCHDAGLSVLVRFKLGNPSDPADCFERALTFCDENEVELADWVLQAPPWGSKVYINVNSEGRLLRKTPEWFDGHHAIVRHEAVPGGEMEASLRNAWHAFYGKASLRRRLKRHLPDGKFPVTPATPRPYDRHELIPLMNLALKVAVAGM